MPSHTTTNRRRIFKRTRSRAFRSSVRWTTTIVDRPRSQGSLNKYLIKRLLAHIKRQEREILALPAKIREIRLKMQTKFVEFKKQIGIMKEINQNFATLLDKFRTVDETRFKAICDQSEEITKLHSLLSQLTAARNSEGDRTDETIVDQISATLEESSDDPAPEPDA